MREGDDVEWKNVDRCRYGRARSLSVSLSVIERNIETRSGSKTSGTMGNVRSVYSPAHCSYIIFTKVQIVALCKRV